jgi:hypothetical protein
MRWLITTTSREDIGELRRRIAQRGGETNEDPPVPIGTDEQVLQADGPPDLPELLADDPAVRGVHPDSDYGTFGSSEVSSS